MTGAASIANGSCHEYLRLAPSVAARVAGDSSAGLVLRRSWRSGAPCHGTANDTIRESWLTWKLGEMGIAPRVHAMWLTPLHSFLFVIVEAYTMTLEELVLEAAPSSSLRDSPITHTAAAAATASAAAADLGGVQAQLESHWGRVARLGVLLTDIKMRNQVVRRAAAPVGPATGAVSWGASWEVRLVDFEVDHGLAAVDPLELPPELPQSASCLELIMLTISAGTFACKHRLRASAPRLRELARSSPTCAARLDRTTDERHGDKASRSASLRPSALWERIDLLLDRLDFFFADYHGPSKSNATNHLEAMRAARRGSAHLADRHMKQKK